MKAKKMAASTAAWLLALLLCAGCGVNTAPADSAGSSTPDSSSGSGGTLSSTGAAITQASDTISVFSDRDLDASYDPASAVSIRLNGDSAEIQGTGCTVKDNIITITSAGVYLLSGTLTNGQIRINAADTDKIQLVLNGASVHMETGPAVWIQNADKVFLTLADGTENTLTDGTEYILSESDSNADGVIFSKADLTVNGSGALNITGSYKHGIVSKDDLIITGGTLAVTAVGQALNGKDCVKIKDGAFMLESGGDAIQSDNTEDTEKGFVYIGGGTFTIHAETDGIQAETVLQIDNGSFTITTGGGSANASTDSGGKAQESWGRWGKTETTSATSETAETAEAAETSSSAKALKAGTLLSVGDGTFLIDSSDDSLHSNGDLQLSGGTFTIASGDDGIHADDTVVLDGGTISITQSYEGIEGNSVTINGGEIDVTARDDGINSAGGSDGSAIGGRPGQNNFSGDPNTFIRISGGKLTVNAIGDGLDSNANLYIDGGETLVNGPTSGGDGALDYDGQATVTGGTLLAVGSSAMAQGFSDTSGQCSLLYNLSATAAAGSAFKLTDADGKELFSYTPAKEYQSVLFTSPELQQGASYTLTCGDETAEITLTAIVTSNGRTGMNGGMGGGKPGHGQNGDLGKGEGLPSGERPERGSPPSELGSGESRMEGLPAEGGVPPELPAE